MAKLAKRRIVAELQEFNQTELFPWFHDIDEDDRAEMWFHCLHCNRCFQGKEAVPEHEGAFTYYSCPTPGCGGSAIDWHSWDELKDKFKREFEIDLVEFPRHGISYDLNRMAVQGESDGRQIERL